MYHFDYISKWGGTVFEGERGRRVTINNKNYWSLNDFINNFVLIENYKHPFIITTTAKRFEKIDKMLLKMGYAYVVLEQCGENMGEYTINKYGAYYFRLSNPFKFRKEEV